MNFARYVLIILISAFINLNVLAAPTHVTEFSINKQEDVPTGIAFNSDGTKMFIVGIAGDDINEYSISVAYDLSSTVTHLDELPTGSSAPQDVAFNANGTEVFVVDTGGNLLSWTLASAYDVSNPTANHDIDLGGTLRGLKFNNNGSKMFVLRETSNDVVQYTLSTAYDPSTRSSTTVSYVSTVVTENQQGIAFSSDGTKMYLVRGKPDGSANWIVEYNLSIGYDLSSTITHVGTHEVNVEDGVDEAISALTFKPDGSKMFHADYTKNAVQEYTLDCGYGLIQCINPTNNDDDVALVEVQSEVSKKLIQHTTFPVLNRMEWLRRNQNSNNLTNQNIKFQFSNEILASLSNLIIPASLSSNNSSSAELQSGNWSYWSEGTVSIGKIGDSLSSSAKNINTSAITIGADKKTDNGKMFGAALRFGNDDIDFGNVKNSLGIDAVSLTLYETRPHGEGKFIDSLIGIGSFKTDIVNAVGSSSTDGSRDGKQIFSSFKIRETFKKNELNITPKIKLDLGFTSLSDYSESGSTNLKFDRQNIGTIITSIGGGVDSSSNLRNGTFKPYFEYDYFLDISPSSEQKISYISDAGSTYILSNINSSTHNFKSKLGFDFTTHSGWDFTSSYQRTQSKKNGYSDSLYFGANYISRRDIEYAMSLDNDKAILDYKRNINGFIITVGSNYNLMSEVPDYGANIEISNTF